MIKYTSTENDADLEGILRLQKINLAASLQADEILSQGFVTVDHSYDQLKRLNDFEKHIIVKDNDRVIGYLLAMTKDCRSDIPVLIPMFTEFDNINHAGKKISEYNYIAVGQVCIDKQYRGIGILDECYKYYKNCYSSKYDFAITEIARNNQRSLKAHSRIGFKEIYTFITPDHTEWVVVLWDWQK